MAAIKKMVDRIQSGGGPTPTPTPTPNGRRRPRRLRARRDARPDTDAAARVLHRDRTTRTCSPGRAHDSLGYALANGSNQNMGLDNVFYQTTLKKTGPNYYVIGCP